MTMKLSDFKAQHDNLHNVINVGCPWCEIHQLKAALTRVSSYTERLEMKLEDSDDEGRQAITEEFIRLIPDRASDDNNVT